MATPPRAARRATPLRRLSIARTAILLVVVVLAVLAFTPFLGPLRILFRGVLILGVLALALSYVWPWVRRAWPWLRRLAPKR